MGGIKKTKFGKNKESDKNAALYLVTIVPLTLLFCLAFYLIIQGIMERLGLSPIIFLAFSSGSWMTSGEAVLMFVLWLGVSIALGTIFAYLLIRKLAS